jgi:homoserine O-acetyltransferase
MVLPDAQHSVGVVQTQFAQIALPAEGFRLEGGGALPALTIAYETYGELSARRDNVIFICPTLTSDAHAAGRHDPADEKTRGWWDEMIGPGKGIDTCHYHVVCANILGGCMGTTGPSAVNPRTGRPYGATFPRITLRDIVNAHRLLLGHLGIERLAAVIGGSLGGMQALDWAVRFPDTIERCVCIAAASSLSAQALAFDIVGRNAITADPNWRKGDYYGTGYTPADGLAQARRIGHITYLSQEMMDRKFGRERREGASAEATSHFRSSFEVERYLDHQGAIFVKRFDANSYLHITAAMDEYDLLDYGGSLEEVFEPVNANVLIVALSADWLFPPEQSIELANALLRAGKPVSYCRLHAPHGHDAFLVDIEHLTEAIRAFLPWVGGGGRGARRAGRGAAGAEPARADAQRREEYGYILDMIRPGSRVLDLGCGSGELLSLLAAKRGISGIGVEIDLRQVIDVIDRGHSIFQGDIDAGLAMIPDGAYDYAILSETLQVVRDPRLVLNEMLRVARKGIVSFPNFGMWRHRLQLLCSGRMPKNERLPYEWYDTPNIHLFTLRDFCDLCHQNGFEVLKAVCLPAGRISRALLALGFENLGADRVLAKIAKAEGPRQPPDGRDDR